MPVLADSLKTLLAEQGLAVLSTQSTGQPYASLVAFAASSDGSSIWFATQRATRKYANLLADKRAAMLIDNRANQAADVHQAMAATATGSVRELQGEARTQATHRLLSRHPYLTDFVSAPTCAVLQLHVDTYYVVEHFQQVTEYHLS